MLLVFFIWYGVDAVRARDAARRQLDVLRRPDRPDRLARVHRDRRRRCCSVAIAAAIRPTRRRRTRRSRHGARSAREWMTRPIDEPWANVRRRRRRRLGRDHRRRGRERRRRRRRRRPTTPTTPTPTPTAAPTPPTPMTDRRRPDGRADARRRPTRPRRVARRRPRSRPRRWPPPAAARSRAWPGSAARPRRRPRRCTALLRLVARFAVLRASSGSGSATSGQEHIPPAGGYLLVAAAHRGWMDPFVVMHALPTEPRAWFLGSAPVDVHVALARVAHPPRRRPAAGLARRDRRRAARRLGAGGRRQRRGLRPDARGDRQRPARAARAVPDRLGDHRPAHRRPDRAARDGRHRGAVPRPADGVARAARRPRSARSPGCRRTRRCPSPARARSSTLRARDERPARRASSARSSRRCTRATVDPPGPSAAAAAAADLAAAAARPARSGRLTDDRPRAARATAPDRRASPSIGVATARVVAIHGIGRCVFAFRTDGHRTRAPAARRRRPSCGGWIAAGLPHRTWVDPFVVADALPVEPRLVFFGDGPAIFRSRWRRWLVRRIGGVIPIWPAAAGPPSMRTWRGRGGARRRRRPVPVPRDGPGDAAGTARPLGWASPTSPATDAPIVPSCSAGRTSCTAAGGSDSMGRSVVDSVGSHALTTCPCRVAGARRRTRSSTRSSDAPRPLARGSTERSSRRRRPSKRWRWLTTAWH